MLRTPDHLFCLLCGPSAHARWHTALSPCRHCKHPLTVDTFAEACPKRHFVLICCQDAFRGQSSKPHVVHSEFLTCPVLCICLLFFANSWRMWPSDQVSSQSLGCGVWLTNSSRRDPDHTPGLMNKYDPSAKRKGLHLNTSGRWSYSTWVLQTDSRHRVASPRSTRYRRFSLGVFGCPSKKFSGFTSPCTYLQVCSLSRPRHSASAIMQHADSRCQHTAELPASLSKHMSPQIETEPLMQP